MTRVLIASFGLLLVVPVAAQQELTINKLYIPTSSISSGSGSPEGVVNAPLASTYHRIDTGQLYLKVSGSGNTGWVPITAFGAQSANSVLAGPASGAAALPVFRGLQATDVPSTLNATTFGGHVLPLTQDTYDLGSANALWRFAYIAQLNAVLFAQQTQTLFGGWLAVTKNSGTFATAVSSGATTINFGTAMNTGAFVVVRSADTGGIITSEFIQVGTLVSGTTYNVTRNLSGAGAKNWSEGTPFAVRGVSGDGWIELQAFDTPRFSVFTQGSAYNNSVENIRIGHLSGMPNSSSGIGFYAGSSSRYIRWDGTDLTLVSDSTQIDGNGVTVGVGSGVFNADGAYRFARAVGSTFGQANDKYAVHAYYDTGTTAHWLNVDNTLKGLASGSGGTNGTAVIDLTASGWDATANANTAERGITITSNTSVTFPISIRGNTNITGNQVTTGTINERNRALAMGEWTTYTPSLSNLTLTGTNAQSTGRYSKVGTTVTFTWLMIFGSTSSISGGPITITTQSAFSAVATSMTVCHGTARDNSSGNLYPVVALATSGNQVSVYHSVSPYAATSSTVPFTWAQDDQLYLRCSYEET